MIKLNSDVEKALVSYLDVKGLDDKTKNKYLEFYNKFSNVHAELNQQTLDEFLKYNTSSPARAMVKHLITSFTRWEFPLEMKELVMRLDIPKRTGRKEKKKPLHLDFKELEYLINHMSGDSILNERDRLSILVHWWGGLRINELLGITYESLEIKNYDKEKDFQKIKISSESAKFGKEGYCYVPTKVYKMVINYLKRRSSINSDFARKLTEGENIWGFKKSAYTKLVRGKTRLFLGRSYNTHSLRHGRGTDLIKKGVPLEKVKEILRHKDISSTQIYTHLSEEDIEGSLV